jgi:hypothetical protein
MSVSLLADEKEDRLVSLFIAAVVAIFCPKLSPIIHPNCFLPTVCCTERKQNVMLERRGIYVPTLCLVWERYTN